MTVMACRFGTASPRVVIRTHTEAEVALYAGTLSRGGARPARHILGDGGGHYPPAPVRLAPRNAVGLALLLGALRADTEVYA